MAESIKDCNEASNIVSESPDDVSPDNSDKLSAKTSNNENKAVAESTWWSSWMNSAKSKSATVFEAVKRDLDEISNVVRSEVSNAGSIIGESLKLDEPESTANTVKKSISSFFGQVSEVLVPTIEDDDTEAVLITSHGVITLSGFQKHLAELQSNDETYLSAPDEKLIDNYQRWLEVIEQDQFTQNQLAKHLSSSEILNEKYLKLVPDQISHMEFWKRYLFKRALLEDALAHAELAERRAKAEIRSTKTVSPKFAGEIIQTEQPKAVREDDDVENDECEQTDDILKVTDELIAADGDIKWETELSEEQQTRLFAEYEAEMIERERREKRKNQNNSLEDNKTNQVNQANSKNQKSRSKKPNANKGKSISKLDEAKGKTIQKPSLSATKTSTSKSDNISPTDSTQLPRTQGKQSNDANVTTERKKRVEVTKADAESASDESWEKDFDLSDN